MGLWLQHCFQLMIFALQTIKFFPIFFLEQVGLPPVGTNFVMAGTPLAIAVMSSLLTPKIAQYLGQPFIHRVFCCGGQDTIIFSQVMTWSRNWSPPHPVLSHPWSGPTFVKYCRGQCVG